MAEAFLTWVFVEAKVSGSAKHFTISISAVEKKKKATGLITKGKG